MYKKRVTAFLLALILLASTAFPALAQTTTTINMSGPCTVVIRHDTNSSQQSYSCTTTASDSFIGEDSGNLAVSVAAVEGYYTKINGNVASSMTFPVTVGTITISSESFAAPTATLSANATVGGLNYTINDSSGVAAKYDLFICDSGGVVKKTLSGITATSGSIGLDSAVVAGTRYVAKVRAFVNDNKSAESGLSGPVFASAAPKTYNLVAKATEGGAVATTIAGKYSEGAKVNISATANTGYKLVNWTTKDGGTFGDETADSTTYTMPAKDATIFANFKKTYTFVIMSSTGGKVWDVDGNYYEGETVKVSAIPGSGYVFDSWVSSDGGKFANSKEVNTTFTMPANATTVTATFKEDPSTTKPEETKPEETKPESDLFELKAAKSDGGNIVMNQSNAQEGQKITVRANAKVGFIFDGWTSEGGGTFADPKAPSTTFTMPGNDVTISAKFIAGEGTPGENTTDNPDETEKPKSGSSLIWILLLAVGGIAIASAVVWIILDQKRRKADAYQDDRFTDDSDSPEEDSRYSDDDEEDEAPPRRRSQPPKKKNPPQKSKPDNKFRANDNWDD